MTIFWPTNTKSITDSIRDAIGRDITLVIPASGTACPTCSLNPITNASTDPLCPTCSGIYWINAESLITINAHVTQGALDIPWRVPGGSIGKGDATIQVEYTAGNLSNIENAKYFLVDGIKFFLKNKTLRGVPEVNRIIVVLSEQEN